MADNLITTNITANADFTGLRAQLAAVTAQLVKLQETTAGTNTKLANQIAVMNKSFAETMRSTGQFSTHFVSLSSDVDKFGNNLDKGRLKLSQYYNTWSDHTKKTSGLVRELAKQQVMLQQAIVQPVGKNAQGLMQYNVMVAKGLDEIKNKTLIARQEMAIMNKVMLDGSTGLINWGKNTQWAGRQLTVGLTVPLVAFGAAAQKAFKEADQELVRLTKVYGGLAATSQSDLKLIRDQVKETAREIAGSYGVAFKDTIALAADLAATGQQGNDLIEATRQTTRLAVLGEVDRQDAMKATLAIQNAFKQNTVELTESIDFLNAVENQTSTSLADLTEAIPKAGPVIKALGGDVKDLALYLTAMKEGGVNAAEGANAIKSAMASLINPTKVATEQFAGFGIDLKGIVNDNAGDLTATILELQAALDGLNPLDKSRAIEQLFGKFQFARMSALFENLGKSGSQTLQVMDLMKASATDLANISERELKMMTESASGQFKRAWASVQADLATAGEQFLRISTKVLKVVDAIIKFFQNLPGPVKTFLNALGGITAIAGPLIMMAGVMGNFIGYVIKGIFHLRQLAKGGDAFRLLTPEIIAAEAAANGLSTTFYKDSEATLVLSNAVNTLTESFKMLEASANSAKVSVQPAISTVAGGVIASGGAGQRVVDKDNSLVGKPYSRDMSHLIPSGTQQQGTIFGTVPGAKPVNIRIGANPQAYMSEDMPKIPGVTSVNGISTGIVAQEAAKWHAMTAAIAMQSEAEIKILKAEVMATGTVTSSLSDSYQLLLPEFTEITTMAAAETKAIVSQLQASKITVDQARAKVIALNATVEAMLAETASAVAAGSGRTVNLTTVPFTSQPVVDPATGKSNMKEMFHKGTTKDIVDRVARALGGVRTSGAGYNIQTTKPKFAEGGIVPGTGNSDTYHTTAEPGAFVINKKSTEANMPTISNLLGGTPAFATGGQVPVVLTPGEAVIPAKVAQGNMPLMYALNGGPGNTSGMGRNGGGGDLKEALNSRKVALTNIADMLNSPDYYEENRTRYVLNAAWGIKQGGANSTNPITAEQAITYAEEMFEEHIRMSGKNQARFDSMSEGPIQEAMEKRLRKDHPKFKLLLDKRLSDAVINARDAATKTKAVSKIRGKSPILNPKERSEIWDLMKGRSGINQKALLEIDPFSPNAVDRAHGKPIGSQKRHAVGYAGQAVVLDSKINKNMYQYEQYGIAKNWLPTFTPDAKREANLFLKRIGLNTSTLEEVKKAAKLSKTPGQFQAVLNAAVMPKGGIQWLRAFNRGTVSFSGLPARLNKGGSVPGQFAQRLFPGGGVKPLFLGMPRTIKQVAEQRSMRSAMERANIAVKDSRFAKMPITEYDGLIEPTSGRSFPVQGIGGVYSKGANKVFVKPVLDEKAALAEMRGTQIARDVHGLQSPKQKIVVMRDPSDPAGKRRVLALESEYNESFAKQDGKFSQNDYFKQLVASALRGDKDLGSGNLSGNVLSDVGPAGVFLAASGLRDYSPLMPSVKDQAMINLLGVKGSSAKKFFAESTSNIPQSMTSDQYHQRMISEIEEALPKLRQTIGSFDLNAEEKVVYNAMIKRLVDSRSANYQDLHGVHSAVVASNKKSMTPAAIAKMIAADELKRRQKGHSVSLSNSSFKTADNGFAIGGMIGNVLKGKAMHRIGAGFGPTGEPKPSMYESAPWGVNSLSIQMAESLFANSGLRKHTQKLFYDKFAAALAKEKPYGYVKMPDGKLKNGLEPDSLDSVVRLAASDLMGDRGISKQLSPIDKDILRKKFLNWESKKDTPLTDALRKMIFSVEAREKGGPVNSGQPYLVGEKGPELFVPRNSGGIIPNKAPGYAMGGQIAGMSALMILPSLIASKFTNPMIQMIAQIAPMIVMQSVMMKQMQGASGAGKIGGLMSKIPASATTPVGVISAKTGGLTKYGSALTKMSGEGNIAQKVLSKVMMSMTRLNIAMAIGTTAVVIAYKAYRTHNEHLRIGMTQYSMTEEAAKKAGLQFTNYNQKLADTIANIKALRERNQLLYESMQPARTPISMTIEEYKKLRKEVKETYADQIKLINQTKGTNNTKKMAEDLKVELMAAGLSAEDATKKIWAMFKMSSKEKDAASFTLGNKGFTRIETKQDAAARAVAGYDRSSKEGGREGAGAVQTGLLAIDTGIQDMIDKSKKAAKKDKTGNTKVLTEYQAQEKMLTRLNRLEASKKQLTSETIAEMIKQNPALKKIINPMDTVVSLWGKMNLAAKGFTGDLSKLGAEAVKTLSQIADVVSAVTIEANKGGMLKNQYAALDKLTQQQKTLMNAAKGQSTQQQINTREQLKGLQKQIDANNKLADARLKALDAAKQEGDIAREIEKARLRYESAVSTGNTADAQQASIEIQGLQSDLQYNSQKKAIENTLKLQNAPLEAKIKSINDGQQKMSDNAALAGDSLGKLNDKIAKQKQKIDDVNLAMNTLRINAIAAGKTLEEYIVTKAGKQDAAAVVSTTKSAGVKVEGTTTSYSYTPGAVPPVVTTKPKDVTDQALGLMGATTDAVTKALGSKGIIMGSGDIYINNKKIDVSKNADAKQTAMVVKPMPTGQGNPLGGGTYINMSEINKYKIAPTQRGGGYTGATFKDKSGTTWKITGEGMYGNFPISKAGYGTMKLNPNVPTIVGDRGPEMAFGGMVIPNMSKIPYASPRYDVNKAALQFGNSAPQPPAQINYTQHIHASEGMNIDELVSKASNAAVKVLQTTMKSNDKMIGLSKNVRINKT